MSICCRLWARTKQAERVHQLKTVLPLGTSLISNKSLAMLSSMQDVCTPKGMPSYSWRLLPVHLHAGWMQRESNSDQQACCKADGMNCLAKKGWALFSIPWAVPCSVHTPWFHQMAHFPTASQIHLIFELACPQKRQWSVMKWMKNKQMKSKTRNSPQMHSCMQCSLQSIAGSPFRAGFLCILFTLCLCSGVEHTWRWDERYKRFLRRDFHSKWCWFISGILCFFLLESNREKENSRTALFVVCMFSTYQS